MQIVLRALAEYIRVLDASSAHTSASQERSLYRLHLAQAAILFSLVQTGASRERIREKLDEEQRAYGWSFLSGSEGERAEAAFQEVLRVTKTWAEQEQN